MPTLRTELSGRVSEADVEALQGDLAPYGYVDELPSASYDPAAVLLGISFVSGMVQAPRYWPTGSSARPRVGGAATGGMGGQGQNL